MGDLDCTKCEGKGEKFSAHARLNRTTNEFEGGNVRCVWCSGRGTFPEVDFKAILAAITTTRGGRKFRKSMTSPTRGDATGVRAYYVWRLARFHGGADVTMPVMASVLVEGDPSQPMLDRLSEIVARKVYGTDMAAATRWGRLLGRTVPETACTTGLPDSSQEGGPVHDGNDPMTNALLAWEDKGQ